MSYPPQVQQFLSKLEELHAVFVLGRRSFPFLEEIIGFVQDITVLLEEVNTSIHAHDGEMPRAASQLKSVSEATELATNEILDLVDEIFQQLRALEKGLKTSEACFDNLAEADEQLMKLLVDELGEEHDHLLAEAERLNQEKRALRDEGAAELATAREALAPVRAKMNHIMMSLQVQDITSQQIASVNHLIESVRGRMAALLGRLGSGNARVDDLPTGEVPHNATFDSKARYDHSPDRQRMADDLISSLGQGVPAGSGKGHGDGAATSPPEKAAPSPSKPAAGGSQAASQDDIDAMFGDQNLSDGDASQEASSSDSAPASGAGGAASQDDIDELFQQGL